MITLGEAARLTGLGKTTLARAIKAGRLSATKTDIGTYQIDPAELGRVYPFPAPTEAAGETGAAAPNGTGETPGATAALEAQIAGLREIGELLRRQLDDVREDRDRWRSQAERLALPGPVTPAAPVARTSWWWRTIG
jgi:excisionase family DNA binding protein